MTQLFPLPIIQPFERLQVTDGLRITADRWQRAHDYHRHRQNLHYQSVHQPGIVYGLGVYPTVAPADVPSKYRDGYWLQIQPGIAIDVMGNPIIVPEPIDFHITTRPTTETVVVYLVLSYVDPTELKGLERQEMVRETFRIDEKNSPPIAREVELCRIQLSPDGAQLEVPGDVFAPGFNQIDVRDRLSVQARPHTMVMLAEVVHPDDPTAYRRSTQLASFVRSVSPLYPAMGAQLTALSLYELQATTTPIDLLYFTGEQPFLPTQTEATALQTYLEQGGVLLVDVPATGAALAKSMMDFAQSIGTPLQYLEPPLPLRAIATPDRQHPLRTSPFVFAQLPHFAEQPIQVLVGGGIVLVLGDLASAWGVGDDRLLPREMIRTAQEFGINILSFAAKRRNWMQLVRSPQPLTYSSSSPFESAAAVPRNVGEKPHSKQMERIIGQL